MKYFLMSLIFLSLPALSLTRLEDLDIRIQAVKKPFNPDQQQAMDLFRGQNSQHNSCSSLLTRVANRFMPFQLLTLLETNPSWLNSVLAASFSGFPTAFTHEDRELLSQHRFDHHIDFEIETNKDFTDATRLQKSLAAQLINLNPIDASLIPQKIAMKNISLSSWEKSVRFHLTLTYKDHQIDLDLKELTADYSKPLFDDVAEFVFRLMTQRHLIENQQALIQEITQLRDLLLSNENYKDIGQDFERLLNSNKTQFDLFVDYLAIKSKMIKRALKKDKQILSFPAQKSYLSVRQRLELDPNFLNNHSLLPFLDDLKRILAR